MSDVKGRFIHRGWWWWWGAGFVHNMIHCECDIHQQKRRREQRHTSDNRRKYQQRILMVDIHFLAIGAGQPSAHFSNS